MNTEEKISFERMVCLTEELITGLEQRNFISEQQIMCVYKIKEQLLKERPKHMKQLTLDDMFKNACKQ